MYNETQLKILNNKEKQKQACDKYDMPDFAPESGICWSCHRQIYEADNLHFPITGCPYCHRSYCD